MGPHRLHQCGFLIVDRGGEYLIGLKSWSKVARTYAKSNTSYIALDMRGRGGFSKADRVRTCANDSSQQEKQLITCVSK